MAQRNIFSRVGEIINTFSSAVAVSWALDSGHRPRSSDLRKLGVNPKAFGSIRSRY